MNIRSYFVKKTKLLPLIQKNFDFGPILIPAIQKNTECMITIPSIQQNSDSIPAFIPAIQKNTECMITIPSIQQNSDSIPAILPAFIPLIKKNPELAPVVTFALLPTILPSLIPILDAKPIFIPALTKALVPIILSTVIEKEKTYYIMCDNDGMIEDLSDDMLCLLKCDIDTIKYRFIGSIMSIYMSMMHKQFFIGNFNSCGIKERNKIENKLKIGHRKRPILIYDIEGNSHSVGLSIIYNKCPFNVFNPFSIPLETLSKRFYLIFDIIEEPLDIFYTYIPMLNDAIFKESELKVVIICIDFVDSTATLTANGGALLSIDNSIKFHKIIVKLIREVYYPFIYLHEVIGDSFIIALNTDWAYTSEKICASLAINFIFDLIKYTHHFVKIRTGLSYGILYYGTIGNTFRFFGKPINMASRLENICKVNEIILCSYIFSKLILEMEYIKTTVCIDNIHKLNFDLKGFGDTVCYKIIVPNDYKFIVYNHT
jgi:hypothetical protein